MDPVILMQVALSQTSAFERVVQVGVVMVAMMWAMNWP